MEPARPRVERSAWAWSWLGLAGSVMVALAGTDVAGDGVKWWFHPSIPAALGGKYTVFYAGMIALAVAWLGLGRLLPSEAIRAPHIWAIAALWSLPLLLGPALFSHDVYSYLAQGALIRHGLSPYHYAPIALGHVGETHLLHAVSPFWRKTTAPYGPLFLAVVSVLGRLSGSSLVAGVLLIRAFELIGLVLIGVFVPRLARVLGADPARATWWALLSPIVLLELVAAAHNDVLMAGLLVAGVTLAMERRPLLGIALCALATTIKVPAAAAIVFIAVVWARELPTVSARVRCLSLVAATTVVVLAAVTLVSGLGLGWLSTSVFSTPGRVQLAITPATAVGWTVDHVIHVATGAHISSRRLEWAFNKVAFGLTCVLALALLWRARRKTMVLYLGIALAAVALGGPASWPWYLSWGLTLLAACPEVQPSRLIPIAIAISVFVVKPNGILMLPLATAPVFVVLYVGVAAAAWVAYRRRHSGRHGTTAPGGVARRASSALVES